MVTSQRAFFEFRAPDILMMQAAKTVKLTGQIDIAFARGAREELKLLDIAASLNIKTVKGIKGG